MADIVLETLSDILLRLSALEKVLIDKGVITKEDYVEAFKCSAKDFQKIIEKLIMEQKQKTNANN